MLSLFLSRWRFELDTYVLTHRGRALGVLNPSTLVAASPEGYQVLGTHGRVKVPAHATEDEVLAALVGVGALLLGGDEAIAEASTLLVADSTSRTASYVVCVASSCEQIVEFFSRIRESTVVIFGCGGIGSLSAIILAGAGVGKLLLIDPDFVEPSNLNRQFFWTKRDCGKLKTKILTRAIRLRFPSVGVTSIAKRLITCNALSKAFNNATAVVISADTPLGIGRRATAVCFQKRIFAVDTGYFFAESVVSTAPPVSRPRIDFWQPLTNCIAPSYGPTNVRIAGLLADVVLAQIGGLRCVGETRTSWRANAPSS